MFKWFRELEENPEPYLKEFLYPDANQMDFDSDEERQKLLCHIQCLSDREIVGLNFILSGQHGGSTYAFLQMCLAYLQCPLGERQSVASTILHNFQTAQAMQDPANQNFPQPDLGALQKAITQGQLAYINNSNSYSL